MAKRRPKPKSGSSNLNQLLRGEFIGSALVVLALLILLSLLSPNRGKVTAALINALRVGFGVGVWLVSPLLGALGAWLALREVSEQRFLSPYRLIGGVGLFLVIEGVVHLAVNAADPWALALDGNGGGVIGWLFSRGLTIALGLPATIGVLVVMLALSLVALSGLTLAELSKTLTAAIHRTHEAFPGQEDLLGNSAQPLERRTPPWRRWWRQLLRQRLLNLKPSRSSSQPPATRSVVSSPKTAPTTPPAKTAPDPRIIGGRDQTWRLPLLSSILETSSEMDIQSEDMRRRARIIEDTLQGFGVPVQVVEANQGPAVTQFGLRPGVIIRRNRKGEEKRVRVRVSQIQALSSDLSLALAASPIRIEAPVPGRDVVGIEVPNVQISLVALRGVMESDEYRANKGPLTIGLGRDVSGRPAVTDLTRMPHLLIAGATGSGKSVCVNSIITALLLTHTPDTLRFLLIDPKRVELTVYNGIPHLIAPVIVDVERAVPALGWATREMERRYKLFAKASARNIEAYNKKLAARDEQILPYIVILIDELADLMLSAPDDVERHVCRIAQMARATGIHLVIATQRPSVDVVTGLIKANFPARIAFAVTSLVDSRVILDTPGAEQLLGRGDMLFMAPDTSKLQRLQGCFVSDRETQRLVQYWKGARTLVEEPARLEPTLTPPADSEQSATAPPAAPPAPTPEPPWLPGQEMLQQPLWSEMAEAEKQASDRDALYDQAVAEVRKAGRASISLLQRRLRIGYSRAARLIDQLEDDGIVGPDQGGSRGREVLLEPRPNVGSAR